MTKKSRLDHDIERIVSENGIRDVIAALSKRAGEMGMVVLSRRLNKIYEWMIS